MIRSDYWVDVTNSDGSTKRVGPFRDYVKTRVFIRDNLSSEGARYRIDRTDFVQDEDMYFQETEIETTTIYEGDGYWPKDK